VTAWDNGTPLNGIKEQEIIDRVKRALESQGMVVDLS